MASFSRVVHSTIKEYFRKEEVNILRRRRFLALLRGAGRITTGHAGESPDWKVRYKRAPLIQYADAESASFVRRSKRLTATLPWRSYLVTDQVTKMEKLQNNKTEAIIKIMANVAKELAEDLQDQFCEELFVNGDATGNEKRIHGLESALKGTAAASGGYVVDNSGTYAGLSTVLANYGGTWTGTWPDGTGDSHYDFWSGLLVDYTDTAWAASTKTWPNTCIEAMRYGIIHAERNDRKLDVILLEKSLYRQFLDAIDDKERIVIDSNKGKSPLYNLGFGEVQHFDGVDITWEHGVPANTGYGVVLDGVELMSLQPTLFSPEMKDFDMEGMSFRFAVDFYGNMRCNPRKLAKWKNVT